MLAPLQLTQVSRRLATAIGCSLLGPRNGGGLHRYITTKVTQSTDDDRVYVHNVTGHDYPKAVSFLNDKQCHNNIQDPAIIGYLKEGSDITPKNFVEVKAFVDFMHYVVQKHCASNPVLETKASVQEQGWFHIPDEREPTMHERIPHPDNIVASVKLLGGKMQTDTYQRCPTHRVITMDGIMRLEPKLHALLVQELADTQRPA
eukprot:Clim_evm5s163 gene=Clim_evmTU5s163